MKRVHPPGVLTLLAAVIGALATATPASATSVVGFGNAAFDNACTSSGSSRADAATRQHGGGTIAGLGAALPISSPGTQCGTLGLPTALHEEGGIDVIGTETGGEV